MKTIQDIRTVGYLYYDIKRAAQHTEKLEKDGFILMREWVEGNRIKRWFIKDYQEVKNEN